MLIDQRKLKLLVLASCHDECIIIYFKTFSFSKFARILRSNWSQNPSPLVSWCDIPTCKDWCWLIKGNLSYHKKTNVWLKTTIFSKLARILQSNWPQKHFPPVSWYDPPTCKVWCWLIKGNSSYHKKKLMFDTCPPARLTTDILKLITRFHLVKTWFKNIQDVEINSYTAVPPFKMQVCLYYQKDYNVPSRLSP